MGYYTKGLTELQALEGMVAGSQVLLAAERSSAVGLEAGCDSVLHQSAVLLRRY